MADKKISALTGASTPLAGTEVLPIVQSGSTVKVSIANVTAGRAVSFLNSTWNTTGFCDGSFLGLVNTNPAAYGQRLVIGNYSETSATLNGVQIATTRGILTAFADGAVNGNGATISVAWANGGQGPLKLAIGATTTLQLEANGDVAAKTGNLVIGTPNKGIVDSTGTTNLQFTAFQVVSNKQIIAPSVATATGSTASTPTATPVTLFTPSGDGVWIVNALVTLTGAPAAYIASSMIKASGGVLAATAISTATNMSISVSGANVQATQTSGGDQIIAFSYIRLF